MMDNQLHALIVEDSQSDTLLLLRELRQAGYDVDYVRVDTEEAMVAALENGTWDVILSDFSMPSFSATEALRLVQERDVDTPFIIVSGTMGEETAVSAMKAGAHDYFQKGKITRLSAAIERERREARERQQRRRAEEELKQTEKELKALYNATSVLFKADSLLDLGQQIVQAVVREFAQADCGLLLLDRKQNRMLRLARAGRFQVDTRTPLLLDQPGLVSKAIRSGQPIYAPDVDLDPDYVANNPRTLAELVIPLRAAQGVLGVLDLQSETRDAFSQPDQRILMAFAERAAAAIEIRQLYEELNIHAEELEQRVIERTAELHRTKDRVEVILNNSSDAIILVDDYGHIQQTNPGFNMLFGYGQDELFGLPLTSLVEPDDTEVLTNALSEVVQHNQHRRIEIVCRHKTGLQITSDIALAPLLDYQGDNVEVICSVRDITERKQIEEALRKALEQERELNELKSRFVSMVSHEFRTPLAIILSSNELLHNYGDRLTLEKHKEHLTKIATQVKRLTDLLDDVLIMGKAETVGLDFNPVVLDLNQFCRNLTADIQQTTAHHQIIFSNTARCVDAIMDEKLLRQIIGNLLSNAIKYSPQGGKIHFDLSCNDREAVLSIQDAGIVIPEEDQKRLFEVFHRGKNVGTIPGTGLGLMGVRHAVDTHGGAITWESSIDKGTTFTVRLPLRLT